MLSNQSAKKNCSNIKRKVLSSKLINPTREIKQFKSMRIFYWTKINFCANKKSKKEKSWSFTSRKRESTGLHKTLRACKYSRWWNIPGFPVAFMNFSSFETLVFADNSNLFNCHFFMNSSKHLNYFNNPKLKSLSRIEFENFVESLFWKFSLFYEIPNRIILVTYIWSYSKNSFHHS